MSLFVPASIGNVGPGFDVLGLAVAGLGDRFSAERATVASVRVTGRDAELVPVDPERNCASIAARALLQACDVSGDVSISIHKELPLSGGLGGSAASSVGGALAAARAYGLTPARDVVLAAALAGEAAVAGRHLDNIAPSLCGGLTLVLSVDPPRVVALPVAKHYVVALVTPSVRLETKTARAVLPREWPTAQWTAQMARTTALAHALAHGDDVMVRDALDDQFAEPARAALVPGFAQAKKAALAAGALGVSISGAGPTVFALCASEAAARLAGAAMQTAMAPATLHVGAVAQEGAHDE
jgi:homoserine kinase